MKKYVLLIWNIVLGLSAFCQSYRWTSQIQPGLSNTEIIHVDPSGNIYQAGTFFYTCDFNPGSGVSELSAIGSGYPDVFILKVDSVGGFKWVYGVQGSSYQSAQGIKTDDSGNVYICGNFFDRTYFNPAVSSSSIVPIGTYNGYILKLGPSGDFKWVKTVGGGSCNVSTIDIDHSGNIYCTGYFTGKVDFDPGPATYDISSIGAYNSYFLKLDASGNFIWAKHTLASTSFLHLDNDKHMYVTGTFSGVIDFDPGADTTRLTSRGDIDVFVMKLDTAGDFIWAKGLGGKKREQIYDTKLDHLGSIYITGNFNDTMSFDSLSGVGKLVTNGVSPDAFIVKIDTSGDMKWAQQIGGQDEDEGASLAVDGDAVYVTGDYKGPAFFGTPPTGITKADTIGKDDIYVTRLDSSGIIRNIMLFGKVGDNSVWSSDITTAGSDKLYLAGRFIKTIDFNPSVGIDNHMAVQGVQNSFLTRMGKCSLSIVSHPASQQITIGDSAQLSVTVSGTPVSYQWQQDAGMGFVNLKDSGEYSGTATATLFISKISLSHHRTKFRCVITDNICTDMSGAAVLKVKCAFHITAQPIDQSITAGSNAVYGVTSSDTTVAYQWQLDAGSGFVNLSDGGQYSETNSDLLSVNNVSMSQNAFRFRCIATDDQCGDTSDAAMLSVSCSLSITVQPGNRSVFVGDTVSFMSRASSAIASYQWQENTGAGFLDISNNATYSGATDDTLTINNTSLIVNGAQYRCMVTEGVCQKMSDAATLTVSCNLSVITQPVNQSIFVGDAALFAIASSSTTATYQWQRYSPAGFVDLTNDTTYSGVTDDTLRIQDASLSLDYSSYRCVITDGECADTSDDAFLNVNCNLTVTVQPVDQSVSVNDQVLFSVVPSSSVGVGYRWQQNLLGGGFANLSEDAQYSGVTNDTLIIHHALLSLDSSVYRCVILDGVCWNTSYFAILRVTNTTGINESKASTEILVYPNPVTDMVFIQQKDQLEERYFSMLNPIGITVMQGRLTEKLTSVDMSKLPAGIYLLQVGTMNYKLLKK